MGKERTHTKQKQIGFVIRTVVLIEMSVDIIHTFIFGNVFGGALRPCCEPFGLSDWRLGLDSSGSEEDLTVTDFDFVVFFVDAALGSLNTISVTMTTHKHMRKLEKKK
jgi:hypothetical protein